MQGEDIEDGIAAREALSDTLMGCAVDQCGLEATLEHMSEALEATRQVMA